MDEYWSMQVNSRVFTLVFTVKTIIMKQVGASETSRANGVKTVDARRLLAERIASSRYVNRSARLRDMLLYLSDRVLEGEAGEIH